MTANDNYLYFEDYFMEPVISTCQVSPMKTMSTKTTKFDDLKKIYLLKTFVEQGSLNKTAQIHKVTPSAVSQSIKSLETSVGFPVIIKTQDIWKITEKGEELLINAEKVFLAMAESFPEAKSEELKLGSLSIGTLESLALELIHNLSSTVRTDHPDIKLNYQILRIADITKKIQSGELCLGIITEIDDLPSNFISEKIQTDQLGLYTSIHSKIDSLTNQKNKIMGTISSGTLGLPSYLKKFIKDNPDFKPNLVCDSFEILKSLAETNDAIALLPQSIASKSKIPLKNLASTESKYHGDHEVLLIASATCDRREFDYVAKLLKTKKILFSDTANK